MRHFLGTTCVSEKTSLAKNWHGENIKHCLYWDAEWSRLAIHDFMAEDPDFFVQVLCDVFLPAHRDKNNASKPTPEVRARAHTGYSLLQAMDSIPGQRKGSQLDEEALLQWINAVREKAIAVDRAAIAEQYIGKILAHSSPDSEDGGWPHQIIRKVIERLGADEILKMD